MNRTRLEFEPLAILPVVRDIRTGGAGGSRRTTAEEQRRQAVDFALEWMVESKVWIVDVLVTWPGSEPSVLTVRGHAEHLAIPGKPERIVPDWDEVLEHTLEGVPIVRSPSDEQARLERQLAEVYDDGLA